MRRAALLLALVLAISAVALAPPAAQAIGPGGWDRLGTGPGGASALNGDVMAMTTDYPGVLIAGGKFTNAGGVAGANRIAFWDGAAWHALGPTGSFNGDVMAVAVANGKIYAGGTFTNAGNNASADFLAVYDGTQWMPFCYGTGGFGGNVHALRVVGNSLFVGGTFQNGGGIDEADYLVSCDLTSGSPSATTVDPTHNFSGSVYALTSDSAGNLYAGGGFSDLEDLPAADNVAKLSGGIWSALGSGGGSCACAVDSFVRSLASDGTNVYVGADSTNIAGIGQADHVARWNGSSWSAVGANAAGTDGYLPAVTSIDALFTSGSHLYATGNWLNVGGDPTADYLADFDGTSWKPVGSNGAGDGALNAKGESFAMFGGVLHVGGNFTKAGGDSLASFLARFVGVPNNVITVGKVKPNQGNGTAKLSVTVPGAGVLTLAGKGIKGQRQGTARLRMAKPVSGAGKVTLKIKAKGKTLKQLRAKGKVKVKVTITFTPTGGTPRSETKKVKLVLRRN
jgi:trimeric autotransporter adhesin